MIPPNPQAVSDQAAALSCADVSAAEIPSAFPAAVQAALASASEPAGAEAQLRRIARSHYENFSVISVLLPKALRQDFCNVYAFCRVADDLGDELASPSLSLQWLDWFKRETLRCGEGHADRAVFVGLSQTIRRHDVPLQPFLDLIDAFEQDQRVNRYDTFEQVVDYCRRSADPVGRIVLHLCDYHDPQRQELSDFTCTALQLTNFWQDVRRDLAERDRIYLPRESMQKFGVTEAQIAAGQCDQNYRDLIRFEVDRAAEFFNRGHALLPLLRPSVRKQVSLFSKGGRAILSAIRRQNYDTLSRRPSLSKWRKGGLVLSAMAQYAGGMLAPRRESSGAAMSAAGGPR